MSLSDQQKELFLKRIAAGHLRYEAAKSVGSTVPEIKRHLKADPEFASAFEDAQLEASEPVESVLYQAALNREPWAVKEWLSKRDKERWAEPTKAIEVKHSGSVQLEPGQTALSAIGTLIEALKERQAIRTGEDSTFASIRAPRPAIEATAVEIRPERAAPPPPEPEPFHPDLLAGLDSLGYELRPEHQPATIEPAAPEEVQHEDSPLLPSSPPPPAAMSTAPGMFTEPVNIPRPGAQRA